MQPDSFKPSSPGAMRLVVALVCQRMGLAPEDVTGRKKHPRLHLARALVVVLMRELTILSYPEIARGFGRRFTAHSSIMGMHARGRAHTAAGTPVPLANGGSVPFGTLAAMIRDQLRPPPQEKIDADRPRPHP